MGNDIVMADGWEPQLDRIINGKVMSVGKDVLGDMQRTCPVDTGDLLVSLTLVNAAPKVARIFSHLPYFPAVELGFQGEEHVRSYVNHDFMGTGEAVVISAHTRHGNTPAQPFARPALYRKRSL
jgi:hypothetical protein